ncbi:MAG: gluconate 2-dehydrogenase subunit 3 family protein [Deltaproteobacteria bacterium]|nr:gluconate 2-dehydrogenase subunit 3 family protein [Deltaproteobacteria bacterium]
MDRREFLERAAALAGGALSVSCTSFLLGCEPTQIPGPSHALFTPAQRELVATATELILPATDTPGALGAGVPVFVEMILVDWYLDDERERFLAGLARLDTLARERSGKAFVHAGHAQQLEILEALEQEGLAQQPASRRARVFSTDRRTQPAFFPALKELTLVGYYTSVVGATAEHVFEPVPARYEGCVPASERDRVVRGR